MIVVGHGGVIEGGGHVCLAAELEDELQRFQILPLLPW